MHVCKVFFDKINSYKSKKHQQHSQNYNGDTSLIAYNSELPRGVPS